MVVNIEEKIRGHKNGKLSNYVLWYVTPGKKKWRTWVGNILCNIHRMNFVHSQEDVTTRKSNMLNIVG